MAKKIDYKKLIQRINERKLVLKNASINLKKKFVGLDKIIDSVIENINVWYIMPELINRPVIVNLWGMTGVGKTDLIRSLVKELRYGDKFLEVQLTNKGNFFHNTIKQYLNNSSIEYDDPGILLLDEVQRFRTKDERGIEIHDCKFQDLWMLLSDGRFANDSGSKSGLLELLFSDRYYSQEEDEEEEELDEEDKEAAKRRRERKKKRQYHQSYYSAMQIKKKLKLSDPVDAIMQWNDEKKFAMIWAALESDEVFEGDSYSKLLIFISGNLDEAYDMADQTGDADHDADVFHEFSSRINIVDIKNALNKRFKPEQISRFGNIHIIYPSLAKKSYQTIIQRKINDMIKSIKSNHGINIKVDKSIKDCIYRNGVFPAQGVRPVFSSVSALLGNSIPTFILVAIEKKSGEIYLRYENSNIIATIDDCEYTYEVECSIDKIKEENNEDEVVLTSIHESGHAVVYAALFGISPTQIVSSMSSSDAGGFIGLHSIRNSQKDAYNKIVTMMAGKVAEEVVFGEDLSTSGASGDIAQASTLASKYCREWAMSEFNAKTVNPNFETGGGIGNYDISKADDLIEKIITKCKSEAESILKEYMDFFKAVADTLIRDGEIKPIDFKILAAKFDVDIDVVAPKESVLSKYSDRFKDFKSRDKNNQRGRNSRGHTFQKPKIKLVASKKRN